VCFRCPAFCRHARPYIKSSKRTCDAGRDQCASSTTHASTNVPYRGARFFIPPIGAFGFCSQNSGQTDVPLSLQWALHSLMSRYDREKIYQEIWAEPIQARREEIQHIRRRPCEGVPKLNIPRPGRYWALNAAGKAAAETCATRVVGVSANATLEESIPLTNGRRSISLFDPTTAGPKTQTLSRNKSRNNLGTERPTQYADLR